MEGRKRSRKNTRQEWKRRVSSALAVVLTAAMVLNTPLSIDGLGGLHISNAFASGSNAEREKKVWATASNAKYKRGESQEVDIYVIAEDNEAVPDNSTFLTLYLRNNTGQMITEGSLTFKGNHIAQKDGYFQDMGTMEEGSSIIVVEGGETEASQEGQLVSEEPSGEGMIYQEPELEDQDQETALLPEEEAQPDSGNLPDEFDEEESEEIQDNEDESEDENEAYELIGIDLQPGEMREIQFEFYTDEDEDSTKAYVEFTFRGDKEDGNRVKSDSKFYYSIGLPFVDLSLEEGTKIESGVSNDMEIWMNEPTWVDEKLEERIEAQEEKEAEEEYEALEETEEEDEVIASGSNAEKNKDQSVTADSGVGQETASPSDADREETSQEQKDQEKINQYAQEAMKISESKVSYEVEIYGAEFERFSPRKAEEAEGLGWISCVYEVANHTEPGLYYGKVRANGRWNNEKFTSEQGFFFEVTGEGRTGQEYTADLNNMTVHAYAEEGVLPEYAKLQVTELSESNAETAEQFQKAVDALTQEGTAYDGMMAVDITFVDENGEEIEPEGEVLVSIEMKEGALPEGVDLSTVEVHHLKEVDEETVEVEAVADGADKTDGTVRSAEEIVTELEEAEASEEEIQAAVSEDAAAVAEFSVASFSTFTITWGNKDERKITVHYVNRYGREFDVEQTTDIIVSNNDWVNLDSYAVDIDGCSYEGAHLNAYDGTDVIWVKYNPTDFQSGWRYSNSKWEPDNGYSWNVNNSSERNVYLVYEGVTPVDTVDSTAEGVHMYMIDYTRGAAFSGASYGVNYGSIKQGIASSKVNENGWPTHTGAYDTPTRGSFSKYFGGSRSAYNVGEDNAVNHLFLQSHFDENGEFYYNSAEYFATLKNDNDDDFTVYNELGTPSNENVYYYQRGNFMPYNTLKLSSILNHNLYSDTGQALSQGDDRYGEPLYGFNETNNFYFGMYIWADFYQPQGGIVEDNDGDGSSPMIFEFTGDDDMWVYIDGVLVLDLGGIHDAQSGYINFQTGEVRWTETQTGQQVNWVEPTNLKTIFANAQEEDSTNWSNNTFADGSYHRIQIFYMERGAGASNLKISFNLKTIPDGQLAVRKDVENYYAPQLEDIEYTMKVTTTVDGVTEAYAGQDYTLFEQTGGGTTDSEGIFSLKYGQTAIFPDIEVGTEVHVQEISSSDTPTGAEIDDNYNISYSVTDSSGQVIEGSSITGGVASAEMPAYGSVNVVVTNSATFTRPIKLVKKFSGTEDNAAPENFEATYTLYEVKSQNNEIIEEEIGSIRYSDMVEASDGLSASYVFWLDTEKTYRIREHFNTGDNDGGTDTLPWRGYDIVTIDPAPGTDIADGIVYLDEDDSTLTNATEENPVDTITITNIYSATILTINKIDAATNEELSGVEFSLYKKVDDGSGQYTEVGKYTTDENGQITLNNLTAGDYRLTETKAAPGYILPSSSWDFTVDSQGEITFVGSDVSYDEEAEMITITNQLGAELPETGGIGLIKYKQVGWMLLLAAFIGVDIQLMARKKQKRN